MVGNMFSGLVVLGLIIGLILWGGWELVDWLYFDNVIKTTEPIIPEIELIVTDNNKIDTLYVYKLP
jgi:hypothetical protein